MHDDASAQYFLLANVDSVNLMFVVSGTSPFFLKGQSLGCSVRIIYSSPCSYEMGWLDIASRVLLRIIRRFSG